MNTLIKIKKKSNIYLAVISRIEPSLEAVFVNYGGNRHGFLPLKEIESSYFLAQTNDPRADIKKILKEGQELLIQVEKVERGNKGAALTTYISLAGCYLVVMPNNAKAGGISRRIEGEDREQMKQIFNSLTIPNNMGVIIRTAGLGKNIADLQWDLDVLLHHWTAIKTAAGTLQAPCLLHQESNIIIRAIRDNLRPDISEILINNKEVYEQAKQYMELLRTDSKNIVKHYTNAIPLFTKFQIESQIEDAYQHEIRLPSGGSIVFDRTEALTAIDINSAQSTKGQDIETTALNTNLEASSEIARQLRLRDVGGLIVIDYIDMSAIKNQREVENRLRDELQADRARIQISRISRFGLLEMSRQHLKTSLGETTQVICNICAGKGSLRTIESLALSLIRIIEEEALKANTSEVQAQLPIELCTFLANEKRDNIVDIEKNYGVRIITIPNPHYDFPNYKITRIKSDDLKPGESTKSYQAIEEPQAQKYKSPNKASMQDQEIAAVKQIGLHNKDQMRPSKPSLLKRLWSSLFETQQELKTKDFKSQSTDTRRKRHDKNITHKTRGNRPNKQNRNKPPENRKPKQKRQRTTDDKRGNQVKFSVQDDANKPNIQEQNKKTQSNISVKESATEILFTQENQNIKSNPNSNVKPNIKSNVSSDVKANIEVTANNSYNKTEDNQNPSPKTAKVANSKPKNRRQNNLNKKPDTTVEEPQKLENEIFVRYDARTKIVPNEYLTKKRFYPRKKLPYELTNDFNDPSIQTDYMMDTSALNKVEQNNNDTFNFSENKNQTIKPQDNQVETKIESSSSAPDNNNSSNSDNPEYNKNINFDKSNSNQVNIEENHK